MACMYVCKLTCFRTGKSSGYFSETIHFELSADLGGSPKSLRASRLALQEWIRGWSCLRSGCSVHDGKDEKHFQVFLVGLPDNLCTRQSTLRTNWVNKALICCLGAKEIGITFFDLLQSISLFSWQAQTVAFKNFEHLIQHCDQELVSKPTNGLRTSLGHIVKLFSLGLVSHESLIHVFAHVALDIKVLELFICFSACISAYDRVSRQVDSLCLMG